MSSEARARPAVRQPPRLPERYRLRRHIASGGMASVWCAEDRILDRTVAIKILAERFAHDPFAERRFKREARAAARVCGHAHVVTLFDVGDTLPSDGEDGRQPEEGRAFIVMEYLAGGTVADALRVGAVRQHEALRWLGEAASALDHAHSLGIVHRDIKPANFLLDRGRVLHVADFGIARLVSEETITSSEQLFGTAAYLSPEQALGRPATSASDGYALAVAAFELLVGERPFMATRFAAQARQHLEAEPPRASERNRALPEAVDEILRRGMAKDPGERFATAGELVAGLRDALTEVSAGAAAGAAAITGAPSNGARSPGGRAEGARQRGGRARQRAGALVLAALTVIVLGIVAVGLAARGGSGEKAAPAARPATPARRTVARAPVKHRPVPEHRRPAAKPIASQTSSTPAAAAAPPTAAELQTAGHEEMLNGDYQTAIGTLRQAVSSSDPATLTYAYALYDLGRSLVLGGDPSGAIPILQQRLRIPNQTPVVRQMLDQALQAAGQAPPSSHTQTQTTPAPNHAGHGAGRRPRPSGRPTGGAGLTAPSHHQGHASGNTGNNENNGNNGSPVNAQVRVAVVE